MKNLNKKIIEDLASVHHAECISVYIPTHRYGSAVLEQEDHLRLKNELRNLKDILQALGFQDKVITEKIKPITRLIDDNAFWREQSAGLAIFLSDTVFETIRLNFSPESFVYVNASFYLKPLIVHYAEPFDFYILQLESDKAKLFEIENDTITERVIEDLMPLVLEETVGYDFKENHLQYHSVQQGSKTLQMHGSGAGKDDSGLEIQKFFRAVNKGILPILNTAQRPLVICGLEHLCATYKKINSYPGLFHKFLPNLKPDENLEVLKAKAQHVLAPLRRTRFQNDLKSFKDKLYTPETAFDMKTIFKAMFHKKVAILFLEKGYESWGTFNPETNDLVIAKKHVSPNVSLTNLACVTLFLQGRKIYELDREDLPFSASSWNAILYQ
ncbi:baeRF7 domain-containing protein [Gaetbulibacter aestuarii]|uniref:Uncharacterized protein n=1 Tax=Gaetbulibacter aestuarii TaxID=1502358 RepID=A0ABW7N354_9FLAO